MVDGGGIKMQHAKLSMIFWGAEWTSGRPSHTHTLPGPGRPSASALVAAAKTLCKSSYFAALGQYGFEGIEYEGEYFLSGSEPPKTFRQSDVETFVVSLLGSSNLPIPNTGNAYDSIYCVLMPSTTAHGVEGLSPVSPLHPLKVPQLSGEHGSTRWTDSTTKRRFRPYVAWVLNRTLDGMTATLSHELAETITDPEGDGYQLNPANPTNWNEIADICKSVAYLDGVAVQSYWSQNDGACVIPQSQYEVPWQVPPPGAPLQVTAISLAFSRELNMNWIAAVRTSDGAGNVFDLYRSQAVDLIDRHQNTLFVIGADGTRADVEVATTPHNGHAYLRTLPDWSKADNLLSLPHFA
jgi:hypothetical protein